MLIQILWIMRLEWIDISNSKTIATKNAEGISMILIMLHHTLRKHFCV